MGGYVVLVGLVAVLVETKSDGTDWAALGMLAVILVLAMVTLLRYGSGATLLTPSGMVLSTLFSKETVPWDRISRIEVRRRNGRLGTTWLIARIHRADGSPVPLPGLVEARSGLPKAEFQDQVGVLLNYWQQATGRTEKVLVTP
jgi:hypothetical protein